MMPILGFIEFFYETGIVDELLKRADADELAIVDIVVAGLLDGFGFEIQFLPVGDGLMGVGGDEGIFSLDAADVRAGNKPRILLGAQLIGVETRPGAGRAGAPAAVSEVNRNGVIREAGENPGRDIQRSAIAGDSQHVAVGCAEFLRSLR